MTEKDKIDIVKSILENYKEQSNLIDINWLKSVISILTEVLDHQKMVEKEKGVHKITNPNNTLKRIQKEIKTFCIEEVKKIFDNVILDICSCGEEIQNPEAVCEPLDKLYYEGSLVKTILLKDQTGKLMQYINRYFETFENNDNIYYQKTDGGVLAIRISKKDSITTVVDIGATPSTLSDSLSDNEGW